MMQATNTNKQLFTTTLIAVSVLSVLFSVSIFRYMKSAETRFKKEKVALVKDKMELKDSLDILKDDMKAKEEAVASLENEKKALVVEIAKLKQEVEKVASRQTEDTESLKKENASLRDLVDGYRKMSIMQVLKDALDRETDENIRRVVSDAATKIGMIKEGRTVSLAPVIVTGSGAADVQGQGRVISADRRNSLVVIDAGRLQGVREGQRCQLYDGQEKIATGSVIKTRLKISAVFVDSMQPRHSMQDLREGLSVTLE